MYLKLLKLKNYINNHNDNKDLLSIIFNSIIDKYPDNVWKEIEVDFFSNILFESINDIMIYTIISYQNGKKYFKQNKITMQSIVIALSKYKVSPFKYYKYTNLFLTSAINNLVKLGLNNKLINPQKLYSLIINECDIDEIKQDEYKNLINELIDYIDAYHFSIFNQDYSFDNICDCLKYCSETLNYDIDEKIFKFIKKISKITNELTQNEILEKIKFIENNNSKNIKEKIDDIITIINYYKYELTNQNNYLVS